MPRSGLPAACGTPACAGRACGLSSDTLRAVLDLGVRTGAPRIYRTRALPDAERLMKLARNWRPWASVSLS